MWSLLKPCAAAWLVLLACLLHGLMVQAAGLRPRPPSLPSTEMAKALQYIEGLQQQSDEPDYNHDGEQLRSQWGLEAGGQDGDVRRGGDQVSQQLLQTLLTSLQGSSQDPKNGDEATEAGGYGRHPFPKHSKLHRKYPLMFEDEDTRENPYKRTNENAEPQYTPQSLATLQSVFQDLGKLSPSKDHKRQSPSQELYRGDDDDWAYEDMMGGGDWTPVEEKVETEEEIKNSREEFDRGLDNSAEADEDDDVNNEDDDDDEEHYVKRSSQPTKYRGKDEPEDFTKLVDYYLLKVLEKTEESEQKREAEDERRSAQLPYDVDPQAVYQLIQIAQKLRVPPEELIELLKSREGKKLKQVLVPQEEADDLERVEKLMQISTYNKDRHPVTKYYSRRVPEGLTNKLKILNLLGTETRGRQRVKPLQHWKLKNTPPRYYASSGRRGNPIFSDPSISDKREGDYDDAFDEDKLATYLAAKMLVQYPKVLQKADLKQSVQTQPKDETLGTFEQAVLDYFDQLASEKGPPSKRHSEPDGVGDSLQTERLDDETLLKMLEYLNPESSENEERDIYGKNIGGM